jgi:CSLREA domain-containing protein
MKIAAFVFAVLVSFASSASADTWTVNSTRDRVDFTPGDGICWTGFPADDGAPECTLRAAVQEANARRFAIRRYHHISLPAGVFLLTILPNDLEEAQQARGTARSAFAVQTGDLDIDIDLGITGAGEGLTIIDGGSHDRVFDVWSDVATIAGFQDLTIRRGFTTGPGGCVRHRGGATQVNLTRTTVEGCVSDNQVGGGMLSEGYTLIEGATFRNNAAVRGAGFENGQRALIYNSTFDSNSARPASFTGGEGGGISNTSRAWLVVHGTTISNNFAGGDGGGILNQGSLTIINSTISQNRGTGISLRPAASVPERRTESIIMHYTTVANNAGTGLRRTLEGGVGISHSIFAGNGVIAGGNCEGDTGYVLFGGNNLEDRSDCGFIGAGDLSGVDPLLGPLADNGGPTLTHALLAGSPAIDAGLPRGRATQNVDQRGTPRPLGVATDIGAYEYGFDPDSLRAIVPLRWEDLFRPVELTDGIAFEATLSLRHAPGQEGKTNGFPAARIVGVKAGDGQTVKFALDGSGRLLTISGVAMPPKQGDPAGNNPVLFQVEVQRAMRGAALLKVEAAACGCKARPKTVPPIVIPPFTVNGK